MTNGAVVGAMAAAAMMNAVKASGSIIFVEPEDFINIVNKNRDGLVVYSPAGTFSKYKYLTSYKGLFFFTKSKQELLISASVEIVKAKKIWVPDM